MSLLTLRATDLKQWFYCRRIVFYDYCKPVDTIVTESMRAGKEAQASIERLEHRRKVQEYGLESAERLFAIWIVSEELGLSGQIDLVLRTADEVIPVDFKYTPGPVRQNHRAQLAAYGLLLREKFQLPVRRAFMFRLPDEALLQVLLDQTVFDMVRGELDAIRRTIDRETLPPPADSMGKCINCEFLNFCNDRL